MNFFKKQPYKIFQTVNILLAVFLFSCGLEEYYYLPQVPQGNINTTGNTDAIIRLPPLSQYYASYYSIFYRVYISDFNTLSNIITPGQRTQISPALASDFSALESITNPANSSAVTSVNTFSNRNYFELEFEETGNSEILPKDGGTLRIRFPTAQGFFPVVSFNDGPEIRLRRSGSLISPQPIDDPFLRNTPALNNTVNADVAARSGRFAYVSMYIVAVGYDNTQFIPVYSKPTHISIFKLPDTTN